MTHGKVKLYAGLLIAIALGFILLLTNGLVRAELTETNPQEGKSISLVADGPGFVSVNPMAFQESKDDAWADFSHQLYNPGGAGTSVYYFPVSIPHGTTITKFTMGYYDSDTTRSITAYLKRAALFSGDGTPLSNVASTTSEGYGSYESTAIAFFPVVDQQSFSYFIEVSIPEGAGTNLRLVGLRVDYGYTSFLTIVGK